MVPVQNHLFVHSLIFFPLPFLFLMLWPVVPAPLPSPYLLQPMVFSPRRDAYRSTPLHHSGIILLSPAKRLPVFPHPLSFLLIVSLSSHTLHRSAYVLPGR